MKQEDKNWNMEKILKRWVELHREIRELSHSIPDKKLEEVNKKKFK